MSLIKRSRRRVTSRGDLQAPQMSVSYLSYLPPLLSSATRLATTPITPSTTRPQYQAHQRRNDSLPTRTPIPPNIPAPLPLLPLLPTFIFLPPPLPNLHTSQPFIIPIIPLPNILRNLHLRLAPNTSLPITTLLPGKSIPTTNIKKLEGATGTSTGGDISNRAQRALATERASIQGLREGERRDMSTCALISLEQSACRRQRGLSR